MSSKFELEKFAIQPTAEQLDICRKDDLFSIASNYSSSWCSEVCNQGCDL